jgi:DNA polymerase-1
MTWSGRSSHPRRDQGRRLAGADGRRRRGRRRDRHAGDTPRSTAWTTLISTGDKDLDPAGRPARALVQHDEQRTARRSRRHGQVRRPAGAIVDYLALVGDTVDGVPGVQKCGPKTAVKWLEQYGSLDEIVAHADEIGGVVGQNLRDHLGFLPLGKKLVTVACDLANLPAPGELTTSARDTETLRELYGRYRIPHLVARTGSPGRRRCSSRTGDGQPAAAGSHPGQL